MKRRLTRRGFLGGTLTGVAAVGGAGLLPRVAPRTRAEPVSRGTGGALPSRSAGQGKDLLFEAYRAAGSPGDDVVAANSVAGSVTSLSDMRATVAAVGREASVPGTIGDDFALELTDPIGDVNWFDGLQVGDEIVGFGRLSGQVQETRGVRPLHRVLVGTIESVTIDTVRVDGVTTRLSGGTRYGSVKSHRFLSRDEAGPLLQPGTALHIRGLARGGELLAARVLIEL